MKSPQSRRHVTLVVAAAVIVLVTLMGASAVLGDTIKYPEGVSQQDAYRMYQEQLDSQPSIRDLVSGDIVSFDVEQRTVKGSNATLLLRVGYADGVSARANMRLMRRAGKWYFRDLTRVGSEPPTDKITTTPDSGVLETILAEQVAHQDVMTGFADGTYDAVEVGEPRPGFRTMTLPVTMSGPSTTPLQGEVVCLNKVENGEETWFVARFGSE